jgi:hypothetical protein
MDEVFDIALHRQQVVPLRKGRSDGRSVATRRRRSVAAKTKEEGKE